MRRVIVILALAGCLSMTACSTSPAASSPDVPTETAAQAGTEPSSSDADSNSVSGLQLNVPGDNVAYIETATTHYIDDITPFVRITAYDMYGNVLSTECNKSLGGAEINRSCYEYTDDGQIHIQYDYDAEDVCVSTTAFEYYPDGTLKTKTLSGTMYDSIYVYYYDEHGNALRTESEDGVLTSYAYEFDASGNPVVISEYYYDEIDNAAVLFSTKYQDFDQNGNMTHQRSVYAAPESHVVPACSQSDFAYNAEGQLVLFETSDIFSDGTAAAPITTKYFYDSDGRMIKEEYLIDHIMTSYVEYAYAPGGELQ